MVGRVVELPLHLKWSGPARYDLDDPSQERALYEVVLREGTAADVRTWIDPARLRQLWDSLHVPDGVREAWAAWFERHDGARDTA